MCSFLQILKYGAVSYDWHFTVQFLSFRKDAGRRENRWTVMQPISFYGGEYEDRPILLYSDMQLRTKALVFRKKSFFCGQSRIVFQKLNYDRTDAIQQRVHTVLESASLRFCRQK
jgi:hypothetical protein